VKINCIVIDDEKLARKGLMNFISEIPFLNLIGAYSNPLEAMAIVQEERVDLIFLDIHMPKMTGFEMLRSMSHTPLTIITTAFPDYALESYELNVIDYLVKPIPVERFVKAVNKVKEFIDLKDANSKGRDDYFFIKCKNRFEKIFFDDLLYIEALQNYVLIYCNSKRYITYLTLKSVEDYLPVSMFRKVQKSFIVSLSKIESYTSEMVEMNGTYVPIGRGYKDVIEKL